MPLFRRKSQTPPSPSAPPSLPRYADPNVVGAAGSLFTTHQGLVSVLFGSGMVNELASGVSRLSPAIRGVLASPDTLRMSWPLTAEFQAMTSNAHSQDAMAAFFAGARGAAFVITFFPVGNGGHNWDRLQPLIGPMSISLRESGWDSTFNMSRGGVPNVSHGAAEILEAADPVPFSRLPEFTGVDR